MDRITLTPDQQTLIDEFKASYPYFDPGGNIYTGSNLVVDDDLQIDNSWEGVVLGGEGGCVWFYVPAWDLILPIDLINYITDRAGPDGQTMPVFDVPEINPLCEPLLAATMAQRMPPRRPFVGVLRDAVARLDPRDQAHACYLLRHLLDHPRAPHHHRPHC
jgi:hypothetical protein